MEWYAGGRKARADPMVPWLRLSMGGAYGMKREARLTEDQATLALQNSILKEKDEISRRTQPLARYAGTETARADATLRITSGKMQWAVSTVDRLRATPEVQGRILQVRGAGSDSSHDVMGWHHLNSERGACP